MGAAWLLISAAVGYWVITLAEHQKGNTKTMGRWLGVLIIIVSLVGTACGIYCAATGKWGACPLGSRWGACGMMMKSAACPMMPAAPPQRQQ